MNNEKAAFQVVFHAHVHVIPRFTDDGFKEWQGKKSYTEGEENNTAQKIISAIL